MNRRETLIERWFPTLLRLRAPWPEIDRSPWRIEGWWSRDVRASRQRSLLQTIHLAASQRLSLGPLLVALAMDHRGPTRYRLKKLGQRVANGMTIADACEATRGAVDAGTQLAIRCGSQLGMLPATLAAWLERENAADLVAAKKRRYVSNYFLVVLVIGLALASYVARRSAPALEQLLEEANVEPPAALSGMLQLTQFWNETWWIWLAGVLLGICVVTTDQGWRWLVRYGPGRWLRRDRPRMEGEILDLLAITLDAGRPIAGTVSSLARYHEDPRIRYRLLVARNEMEQGVEGWTAIADAGLVASAEATAIASAPDRAAQVWTLQRLAAARRSRLEAQTALFWQLATPMILLTYGAGVVAVAMAILGTLASLIETLV